jgi:SYP7 family syntaxin
MSTGLDSLNELALQMNDELEIQNKMLIELDNKTDKSQGKLDRVNERVQDAIKILNSNRSSKICMYVICLILLLLICYGFYEIIKK